MIGGLLNAATAAWLAHRQQRADALMAARLVRAELYELGIAAKAGHSVKDAPHPMWDQYRPLLARSLPFSQWRAIVNAYVDPSDRRLQEASADLAIQELDK